MSKTTKYSESNQITKYKGKESRTVARELVGEINRESNNHGGKN